MKFLKLFVVLFFLGTLLEADTGYVYIENGIKLPLKKEGVSIYNGTPLNILSTDKNSVKVEIEGFLKGKILYATKNYKLKLAETRMKKKLKKGKEKYKLLITIPIKNITDDMEEAWAEGSDLFYDKCTKCHHAKVIGKHTMQEWDVLFNSMKPKAKVSKDESSQIVRFLRAFSKDGILKESD